MDPARAITTGPLGVAAEAEKPGKGVTTEREKRKVVRRDPEKRRVQNLQAQKKYRELLRNAPRVALWLNFVCFLFLGEKLRKRLDVLESLAASIANTRQTAPAREPTTEVALPVTPTSEARQTSATDHVLRDDHLSECNGKFDCHETQAVSSPPFDLFPASAAETPLDPSLWDSAIFIDPYYLMVNTHDKSKDVDCWYESYVECGCPIRHVRVRSKGQPGSSNIYEAAQLLSLGDTPPPSDVYMNNIRIEMTCTISAIWANCLHVGVSELMFCEDDSVSPFYRPGAGRNVIIDGTSQASDSVVQTVQSIFKTLKADLRPTTEQITIRHHPCIDIFPFPTMRKNLLTGLDIVDEDELFHDMLPGLICWAGAGIGKRDRNVSTGKASSGTPWDSRSWEAKPWFLRKYWNLLGGEDGELVQQSEWWRNVRDEDADIWSGV